MFCSAIQKLDCRKKKKFKWSKIYRCDWVRAGHVVLVARRHSELDVQKHQHFWTTYWQHCGHEVIRCLYFIGIGVFSKCVGSFWTKGEFARKFRTLRSSHWVVSIDQQFHQSPWYPFTLLYYGTVRILLSSHLEFSIRRFHRDCTMIFSAKNA